MVATTSASRCPLLASDLTCAAKYEKFFPWRVGLLQPVSSAARIAAANPCADPRGCFQDPAVEAGAATTACGVVKVCEALFAHSWIERLGKRRPHQGLFV